MSSALATIESLPVLCQIAAVAKTFLDIAEKKKNANEVCDVVSRVGITISRFKGDGSRLDISIGRNLASIRACLDKIKVHVKKWAGKWTITKMASGSNQV